MVTSILPLPLPPPLPRWSRHINADDTVTERRKRQHPHAELPIADDISGRGRGHRARRAGAAPPLPSFQREQQKTTGRLASRHSVINVPLDSTSASPGRGLINTRHLASTRRHRGFTAETSNVGRTLEQSGRVSCCECYDRSTQRDDRQSGNYYQAFGSHLSRRRERVGGYRDEGRRCAGAG